MPETFAAADILVLYRLRWRIELAFKRLKSLVGLKRPPGTDPRSARVYVLAHLLMFLLLEPLIDVPADPPARRPPDPTRRLAPVAPTPRHLAPGHSTAADPRPPHTLTPAPRATPGRAAATTPISINVGDKLAHMRTPRGADYARRCRLLAGSSETTDLASAAPAT